MSARRPRRANARSAAITRRRFVGLLAAGSAALAAPSALAAAPKPAAKPAPKPSASKPGPSKPSSAELQKEFERQRKGTLDTLATLRKFPLPPGGDLPVVFRPLRTVRDKER